jgi:hypothetical protein
MGGGAQGPDGDSFPLQVTNRPDAAGPEQLVAAAMESAEHEDGVPGVHLADENRGVRHGEVDVTRGQGLHRPRPAAGLHLLHRAEAFAGEACFSHVFGSATEAGGLLSYGPSLRDVYRRVAVLVDKILKGAMPGDLPVEQVMKLEPVINLKTAQALGLTIPPALLFQADAVLR